MSYQKKLYDEKKKEKKPRHSKRPRKYNDEENFEELRRNIVIRKNEISYE